MDCGVNSNSNKSRLRDDPSPVKIAACTAAPKATASSGLMGLLCQSLNRERDVGQTDHPEDKVPVELDTTLMLLRDSKGWDNESLALPRHACVMKMSSVIA